MVRHTQTLNDGLFSNKVRTFFFGVSKLAQSHQLSSPHHIYSLIRLIVCWVINKTNDKVENFLLNCSDYDHYQSARCSRHTEQSSKSAKKSRRSCFHIFSHSLSFCCLVHYIMFVSIFDIEIMLRADFSFVCLKLVRVDDNELLSRLIYAFENWASETGGIFVMMWFCVLIQFSNTLRDKLSSR